MRDRRAFLKSAAAAAAGVTSLGRVTPFAAPAQRPESVLVIGAGLSGLVCAYRLREAGKRVIMIEARDAPGGRVRTIRGAFRDGLYGELGAARIAETHEYALHWMNDLKLNLLPFAPSSGSQTLVVGDRRARADDADAREKLAPGLHQDERKLSVAGLLVKYIAGVPDDLASGDVNLAEPRWRAFDRMTWPEWLTSRGASPAAIRLMMLGGDSSQFSALFMLQQIMLHRESRQYFKIDGGMDQLPRGLAAASGVPIRYNCRLTRVMRTAGEVRATCMTGDRADTITADRAVLALPFSILREVEFDPPLSSEKTRIINQLGYFPATRFLLQTRRRFWTAEKLNGSARSDAPADIWDMSFGQKGSAGLISLTTGNDRIEDTLVKLSPAAQFGLGEALAAKAFPEATRDVEKTVVQMWGRDPQARGAFSVFAPGQMTAWAGVIGKPESRLHFAGEHLSPWNGWMEGALWSGERAAQEVIGA